MKFHPLNIQRGDVSRTKTTQVPKRKMQHCVAQQGRSAKVGHVVAGTSPDTRCMGTVECSFKKCCVPHARPTRLDASERSRLNGNTRFQQVFLSAASPLELQVLFTWLVSPWLPAFVRPRRRDCSIKSLLDLSDHPLRVVSV